jgi:CheY-like chemotaxis protein
VRLPTPPEPPAAGDANGGAAAPDRSGRSLRILVVEDNIDTAETLAQLLELWGHEVRVAHSGAEAIASAAPFRPEVVLLDIGLPGMNGFEVARVLRNEGDGERRVLVALTGYGQEENREQGRAAGLDHYFTKPVDAGALRALLGSLSSPLSEPGGS